MAKDGSVQGAGLIGRVNPNTGAIEEYPLPAKARNPHTPIFHQGKVWFTDANNNTYGSLDPETRGVKAYRAPSSVSVPYGIVAAKDGATWIAHLGTNKLGKVDPQTGKLREFVLPRAPARGGSRWEATGRSGIPTTPAAFSARSGAFAENHVR